MAAMLALTVERSGTPVMKKPQTHNGSVAQLHSLCVFVLA
jgi:hypothetical protein